MRSNCLGKNGAVSGSMSQYRLGSRRSKGSGIGKVVERSLLLAALKACSILKDLVCGKQIHLDAVGSGDDKVIYVANTLVSMYGKCNSMAEAQLVFDKIQQRDVVTWNALILGYATNGAGELALTLFSQMKSDFQPDSRTFVAALMACASLAAKEERRMIDGKSLKVRCLQQGMSIHSQVTQVGCDSDMFVASTLVDMYAKCGSMVDARSVFQRMAVRDVVCWTALILGYAENGEAEVALELFQSMQREGCAPNPRTYVAALTACASLCEKKLQQTQYQETEKLVKLKYLEIGRRIHSQAAKSGCESEIFVASSLIYMYSTCGSPADAWKVFRCIRNHDVVSWTSMILGYAENGESGLALKLFRDMQREGCKPNAQTYSAVLAACTELAIKQDHKEEIDGRLVKLECLEICMGIHSQLAQGDFDIFVGNCLIDLYAKCGSMVDARAVFDRMQLHNVVTWTALMLGYSDNGEAELALELFPLMHTELGCSPDAQSFVAALIACGNSVALGTGKQIHAQICKSGLESNEFVANSLVDFYGRCGNTIDAERLFDSMANRNLIAWTTLIAGYSRIGDTHTVFQRFAEMQEAGIQPNAVTFLSLLAACSHSGLVDQAKNCFESMLPKYGIQPGIEHYHCMLDVLGRANRLQEAMDWARSMPHEANAITWTTILGACGKWKNVELGKVAFELLLGLEQKLPAAYSLMANLYGNAGKLKEIQNVTN